MVILALIRIQHTQQFRRVRLRLLLVKKTDAGTGAVGVTFVPTYFVWMSANQSADTYIGSVIYQMTHPA